MSKFGIWIDREQAHIITVLDGKQSLHTINSEADFREREPGEESRVSRSGEFFIDHEKSKKNRLNKQLKDYYKSIVKLIIDAEELYIFGPAEAKVQLEQILKEENNFTGEIKAVESADKMSENQMKEKVREFYGIPN